MNILAYSPMLWLSALILAVMPLLLLVFLVRRLAERRQELSRLFDPEKRARDFVQPGTRRERTNLSMNDYLGARFDEEHRFRNYVAALAGFLVPYLSGLYLSFVSFGYWLGDGESQLMSLAFLAALGFVAAALMVIGHVTWRIMRGDAQPRTFVHLSYRLLLTPPLAILIGKLPSMIAAGENVSAAVAFGVGLFPSSALRSVRAQFLKWFGAQPLAGPSLQDIQGLGRDDELRLWEEGITDIQQLAVMQVEDLLVRTHYTLEQIIDWKDQAFLAVYVGDQLATWRALQNRGAMDVLGLAPRYYAEHEEAVSALAGVLELPAPVLERFVDTIYNDPRSHQLYEYLRSTYPTDLAEVIENHGGSSPSAGSAPSSPAATPTEAPESPGGAAETPPKSATDVAGVQAQEQ